MAECSYARCVQQRRNIRRELQRWTRNMVHIVGKSTNRETLHATTHFRRKARTTPVFTITCWLRRDAHDFPLGNSKSCVANTRKTNSASRARPVSSAFNDFQDALFCMRRAAFFSIGAELLLCFFFFGKIRRPHSPRPRLLVAPNYCKSSPVFISETSLQNTLCLIRSAMNKSH